jgi:hypothetical protein
VALELGKCLKALKFSLSFFFFFFLLLPLYNLSCWNGLQFPLKPWRLQPSSLAQEEGPVPTGQSLLPLVFLLGSFDH